MVQLTSRKADIFSFAQRFGLLDNSEIQWYGSKEDVLRGIAQKSDPLIGSIPPPLEREQYTDEVLVSLKDISVNYGDKAVLRQINWMIKPGEYWELAGKNGSGKTTILSMITGDNPKAYGQELYLFGRKKGSGESIWDIKKNGLVILLRR